MASLELDYTFGGDVPAFVKDIQNGRAFTVDGCPTPILNVLSQGKIIIVQLIDRTLLVDLTMAFDRLRISSPVRLKMRFE